MNPMAELHHTLDMNKQNGEELHHMKNKIFDPQTLLQFFSQQPACFGSYINPFFSQPSKRRFGYDSFDQFNRLMII